MSAKWKIDSTLRPHDDEEIGGTDWSVWLNGGPRDNIMVQMSSNGSINTREKAAAVIAAVIAGLNGEQEMVARDVNSWRGEHHEADLRKAIEKWAGRLDANDLV